MAKIQCKICGGKLELDEYVPTAECPYCGTATTFPKLNDSQKENLYNRAEHYRQHNDFDRAINQYERILEIDDSDPEIYWGMTLCRFGIEYVQDPATGKRIPTCHRLQYDSILSDPNYKLALDYADYSQRAVYEAEAEKISEIQKNILAISKQEEPFDIFICYKESSDGGTRTKDSVIAQDIYYQLTNEGYKVFFARITLEAKLGQQYEPYIFAALNSAKVMLLIGTTPEHFNAVWVKNEWSRFLALLKKDSSRLLIPCYKNMDAYDIPEELSMLQAQDMTKIGFIQDLLRGIRKLKSTKQTSETKDSSAASLAINSQVDAWLRRVDIFLTQEDWKSADEYCERILDVEPENTEAYLLKTLAEFKCEEKNLYKHQIDSSQNFALAKKFADENMLSRLSTLTEQRKKYIELLDIVENLTNACTTEQYEKLLLQFEEFIPVFNEAEKYRGEFQHILNDKLYSYNSAVKFFKEKDYSTAKIYLDELGNFEDSLLLSSVATFRILFSLSDYYQLENFKQQATQWLDSFWQINTANGTERKIEIIYNLAQELEPNYPKVALLFYKKLPNDYKNVEDKIKVLEEIEHQKQLKLTNLIRILQPLCITLMLSAAISFIYLVANHNSLLNFSDEVEFFCVLLFTLSFFVTIFLAIRIVYLKEELSDEES